MKTIYFNGPIITMNPNDEIVEAVVVESGKIMALGQYLQLLSTCGSDVVKYDLQGHTLIPGLIDSHSHASLVANSLRFINLAPTPRGLANSIAELQTCLKAKLDLSLDQYNQENWLIGANYNNLNFPNGETLTKLDLDKISTEIPILVIHFSFHSGVANSKLLELLKIDDGNFNLDPEFYERFKNTKELSGVLKESAFLENPVIKDKVTKLPMNQDASILWKKVVEYYASKGYTTIQDGALTKKGLNFLNHLDWNNELILDVIAHISAKDQEIVNYMKNYWRLESDFNTNLHLQGLKLLFDGTLELKTAWLSNPYILQVNDETKDHFGKMTVDSEKAYYLIKWALANNLQVLGHCIGDQASEQYLNLYEKARYETQNYQDLKPIMIHSTLVRFDQLQRMKSLGMLPSFFAEDIWYFANLYQKQIIGKDRTENISPSGWAKKLNLKFSFHHDCPIFAPNPMLTLQTIVSRQSQHGIEIGPQHQLSIEEALATLTINSAYQYHQDHIRGSIALNKMADFVILSRSPLLSDSQSLKDIQIIATIKNNKQIYTNPDWPFKTLNEFPNFKSDF